MNLSIKNVPEPLVERLRARARGNQRSLQGELLSIVWKAAEPPTLGVRELHERVQALGLKTKDEAAAMIREDRDTDHGRDCDLPVSHR
ncbi:MAG: hypothetical protein ABI056_05505 [Caulobacteraceae bacterium]